MIFLSPNPQQFWKQDAILRSHNRHSRNHRVIAANLHFWPVVMHYLGTFLKLRTKSQKNETGFYLQFTDFYNLKFSFKLGKFATKHFS